MKLPFITKIKSPRSLLYYEASSLNLWDAFLQASPVKQILVGLILGMALGLTFPDAAKSVGFWEQCLLWTLKGVALILFLCFVMSSIANQSDIS